MRHICGSFHFSGTKHIFQPQVGHQCGVAESARHRSGNGESRQSIQGQSFWVEINPVGRIGNHGIHAMRGSRPSRLAPGALKQSYLFGRSGTGSPSARMMQAATAYACWGVIAFPRAFSLRTHTGTSSRGRGLTPAGPSNLAGLPSSTRRRTHPPYASRMDARRARSIRTPNQGATRQCWSTSPTSRPSEDKTPCSGSRPSLWG